jgi:hypothetical protein
MVTRTQPAKPVVGLASLPDIKFKQADVDQVVAEAKKTVAASMGLAPDKLPAEVVDAIKASTSSAMNTRTKALIQRNVDTTVKGTVLKGVKPLDMLDARVQAARDGIAHITQDAKVDAVLADTAKLLWKKYSALKAAGFTDAQAFDLVLAEVEGRAARNR